MTRRLLIPAVVVGLLGTTSCRSHFYNISPRPPVGYQVVGPTSGNACGVLLLNLFPILVNGRAERAYEAALRKVTAQSLVDTTVKDTWFTVILGTGFCTEVEGTAIREGTGGEAAGG